jgi:hypothetical protein
MRRRCRATIRLYMRLAAAPTHYPESAGRDCALCRLPMRQGTREWTVYTREDCLPWSDESYCQDCYNYLYHQRGLKKWRFPVPTHLWILTQWPVSLPSRLVGISYKLRPFWGPWEEVDRFRKLNQAIKGGFT